MSYQPHSFVYQASPLISIQPQCSLQRDSSLWGHSTQMPLGRECPLPNVPSINHEQPVHLSLSSSPLIHDTELDKQINDSTKVMEERAKKFLERMSQQTDKLREQNRKNELQKDMLQDKTQDILKEISVLEQKVNIQEERGKLKQEREKMRQEIAELKREKSKEQLCEKLDKTMDYCITRRGHKGEDIDSDWVCMGTTYLLKKIEKLDVHDKDKIYTSEYLRQVKFDDDIAQYYPDKFTVLKGHGIIKY